MHRRSKIVCTMGPAVNSPQKVDELIEAGMNVARLNFSHGTHEAHAETISLLKEARKRHGIPLAIMLDTKGPEIRLGKIENGQFSLKVGDEFWFVKEQVLGNNKEISLTPPYVLDSLELNMSVLIDNGNIITRVCERGAGRVKVRVEHGGVISSTKGVNIPGGDFDLPVLTEQDIRDIKFGCSQDIDLIAASFIRSAEHVMIIKKLLEEEGKSDILVIAKIENREGVQNIDSIIQAADGLMVARGDLGVELPLMQVPRLQKMMIRKCYLAGKPSVTATQMLESMMNSPRPTRAEASDVANAIYDSTSAAMLSGETAVGSYPIEAVRMMNAIIVETEKDFNYYEFSRNSTVRIYPDVPSSVTLASIKTAYSSNAKAIFAFTTSGSTARLLSRLRPEMPILAMTSNPKVYHQMALNWGVVPLLCQESKTIEDSYKRLSTFALEQGYVKYGDLVVVTAGSHFGHSGTTNMIIVDSIGDVLVRGNEGIGPTVSGKIAILNSFENVKDYDVKGKILLITSFHENLVPLLKYVKGVILQNHVDDVESEWALKGSAEKLHLPVIFRAEGASSVLRNELLVTLDPEQAIVYKGIF